MFKSKKFIILIIISFVFIFLGSWILIASHPEPIPLISPLSNLTNLPTFFSSTPKTQHIIYGFLPYWNFKSHPQIDFKPLTHLALFGVAFDELGNPITREKNYTEPGWNALNSNNFDQIQSRAKASHTNLILVMRGFDNTATESIISHPEYAQNCINQTVELVKSKGFQGINIDFEYVGQPSEEIKSQFTNFVAGLSKAIKNINPAYHVSIDMYAEAIDGDRIWDIAALNQHVDQTVIMFYDFHRPTSSIAGPIAPMYGGGTLWRSDITSLLARYTKIVPSYKILLGIPFYGYEWRTVSDAHLSKTYPKTGMLATYQRIQNLIAEIQPTILWDESAMAPWFSYKDDRGRTKQIHYEDQYSIGLKMDLINQHQLAGAAIWALGYETPYPNLWRVIRSKLD
jgi:spore germination protein YaaH